MFVNWPTFQSPTHRFFSRHLTDLILVKVPNSQAGGLLEWKASSLAASLSGIPLSASHPRTARTILSPSAPEARAISMDGDLEREFTESRREIGLPPPPAISVFANTVMRIRSMPLTLSAVCIQERGPDAHGMAVAEDIAKGLADATAGDTAIREESRAYGQHTEHHCRMGNPHARQSSLRMASWQAMPNRTAELPAKLRILLWTHPLSGGYTIGAPAVPVLA